MYTNLFDFRHLDLSVDKDNNIAVFPHCKNPAYIDDEHEEPMYLPSKTPFELKMPYSKEELAAIIEKGIMAWETHEPYTDKKKTIEEYYYNIKGFKNATLGVKSISVGWDDISGKIADLHIPSKTGKYYMTIEILELPEDADWIDFADAVLKLIHLDLNGHKTFKTFRSTLNL